MFSACNMSSASPPRTSPTTTRSGRIRSAARTSARTLTSPAPSAFAGRASSRTTCGCASRSSAVSSMVTMRSPLGIAAESALRSVVLPALVPPATSTFQPASTTHSRNAAACGPRPNASSGTARAPKRRIVTHGPSTASGGITAWRREPSGRRASTMGEARSSRRPSGATTLSTRRTIAAASRLSATGSSCPFRST